MKSGFAVLKASAIALEIGSTVDEPDTMIEPATPAAAGDPAALDAGALAGAVEAAVDGAVLAPLLEQALRTSTAPRASAPRRLELVVVTSMIPPCLAARRPRAVLVARVSGRPASCRTTLTVGRCHQRVFAGSLAFG